MYPPLVLNGLKTRPGLPGTGFATGNCAALADFCEEGEGFGDGLLAATRDDALAGVCFDLRDATFGVAVGVGIATGWPGLVTSEAFAVAAGSGSPKTWRTAWPNPQPTKLLAISAIAQHLQFIAVLYDVFSLAQHIAKETIDFCVSRRPRAHQAINIWLNEFVKMPAARMQAMRELLRHANKESI